MNTHRFLLLWLLAALLPACSRLPRPAPEAILRPTHPPSRTTPMLPPSPAPVKSHAIVFTDERRDLWAANRDGSGENALKIHAVAFAVAPDGHWIAASNEMDLLLITPDGSTTRSLYSANLEDERLLDLAWSPDSRQIGFTTGSTVAPAFTGHILTADVTTGEVRAIASFTNGWPGRLTWSPDGRAMAFIQKDAVGILSLPHDPPENEAIKIRRMCSGEAPELRWSPDSQWVAISSLGNGRYGERQNCLQAADANIIPIRFDGHASTPIWDPSGRYLYFAGQDFYPDEAPEIRNPRLLRFDWQARQLEVIKDLTGPFQNGIYDIAISPDGTRLSVVYFDGQAHQYFIDVIHLAHPKESKIYPLQIAPQTPENHIWTGNGAEIILCVLGPGGRSLLTYDLNTGEIIPLTGEHLEINGWSKIP